MGVLYVLWYFNVNAVTDCCYAITLMDNRMPQRETRAVIGTGGLVREPRNGRRIPTYRDVFAKIGETPARNLEWLLRFVGMPIETLRGLDAPGRTAIIEEVFTICRLAGSEKPAVWKKGWLPDFPFYAEFFPPLFSKRWREVLSLHTIATEAVARCADRLPLRLPGVKLEMDLNFHQWGKNDSRPTDPLFWIFPPTSEDDKMEGAFIYRLACMLMLEGERLGRCESATCMRPSRLFLRTKSDQLFCSNTCRSREAMKKWRVEKTEKRAQEQRRKKKTKQATTTKGGKRHAKR